MPDVIVPLRRPPTVRPAGPPAPQPLPATGSVGLELRALDGDRVLVRASNDVVRDAFHTVITVEGLHEWAEGYLLHRTVNLQHARPEGLRGIPGKALVGVATRVDFRPQLEVEVRLYDPEVVAMVASGRVRGASLEFVPIRSGIEARVLGDGKPALVYHRLSSEPEATGLALTDLPAVPGSDVLEARSLDTAAPHWAFAVVDPAVLNGEVTDPQLVQALRWLPHHDLRTRFVDEGALARGLAALERGEVALPPGATLSREEVIARARAHIARHTQHGVGMSTGPGYSHGRP